MKWPFQNDCQKWTGDETICPRITHHLFSQYQRKGLQRNAKCWLQHSLKCTLLPHKVPSTKQNCGVSQVATSAINTTCVRAHPLPPTCPYAICIDCCIGHSNGTRAGPDLIGGMVVAPYALSFLWGLMFMAFAN